jgi:predicted GNAT superfamily acetyltransferase
LSDAISAASLGFAPYRDGWRKEIAGRLLTFRRAQSRADFEQCERLQRDVFGVGDYDLASFSLLVVIPKTGGHVLGAFDGDRMVGYIQAYGGYVNRQPRLISDLMAVEPAWRGGLGYALKTLQAAVALEDGFPEIVWTVDPLRAANGHLNFERLGAHCNEYVENLYGSDFADGLYGGLPSDRLVVSWPLTSARVRERLLGGYQPLAPDALDSVPDFGPTVTSHARIAIPSDIDTLLATDPAAARVWRFRVREHMERAFAEGLSITGYAGSRDREVGYYLLTRNHAPASVLRSLTPLGPFDPRVGAG